MGVFNLKDSGMYSRRFSIGDKVRIKEDLWVGKTYYSEDDKGDVFTHTMGVFRGKEARVLKLTYKGYQIDIDPIHTYTEEMLEEPTDDLAISEYQFDADVERALIHSEMYRHKMLIDKALDERMFESDPKKFDELVNDYKRFFDENKYVFLN